MAIKCVNNQLGIADKKISEIKGQKKISQMRGMTVVFSVSSIVTGNKISV